MPRIYAVVGERMAQGMNITNATNSGDSAISMLADADEDFNTRYGVYRGYLMAHERVKLIPRHTAQLDLTSMLRGAGAETAAAAVDHLLLRFLRAPLGSDDRQALVAYLEEQLGSETLASDAAEQALRSVLYLILSSPEYQLG